MDSRNEYLSRWAADVNSWKASGLTQSEWCEIHKVNLNTFRYRKRKLAEAIQDLQIEVPPVPVLLEPVPAHLYSVMSEEDLGGAIVPGVPGPGMDIIFRKGDATLEVRQAGQQLIEWILEVMTAC